MSDQDVGEITKTLNLYALAMDTQDWSLFDRILTADADADYTDPAHWRDFATFKRNPVGSPSSGPRNGTQENKVLRFFLSRKKTLPFADLPAPALVHTGQVL